MEGLGRRKKIRESKPSFIVKPRRQFTDEGATAKFKASFDGEPPPTLKWELNSQEVSNGGRFSLTERGDFHYLQISDVTLEDKGMVTCTISNKLDSLSASADLDVFARPDARRTRREKKEVKAEVTKVAPKVEKPLEDQEVDDGGVATLECTFTGTPEPTATWQQNGKPLQLSDDIKQSFNGCMAKLFFREVYPEDEGTYICTVTNSEGEVSTMAKLKVKVTVPADVAPTFTRPLSDVTVSDGEQLTLACEVTAMPDPEIKWYKNGKLLKASRDFKPSFDGRTASLEIVEVYCEDEGKYECEAKNVAGEAKTSAVLTVIELQHSEEEEEPTPLAPPEVAPVSPPIVEKPPEEVKLVSPPSIRAGPRKVSPPPAAVTAPVATTTSSPSPVQVSPPSPVQVSPPSPVQVSPPSPVQVSPPSPVQVSPPVHVAPPTVEIAPSTEQRSKIKVDTTRLNKDRNGSAMGRVPLGINVTKVKPVMLEVLHPTTEDDQKPQKTSESSKTIESTATLEATKRNETKANEKFVSQVTLSVNSNVKPKVTSEFHLVPSDNVNTESNVTLTGTKVAPLQKSDSLVYQMTLSLNKPKSAGAASEKTQNAHSWKSPPVRTGIGSVKESPFKQSEAAGKPVASYVKDHKSNTPRKTASSPFAVSYLKSKSPVSQVTASLKTNSAPAHNESRTETGRKINKLTPTSWLHKSSETSSSNRKGTALSTEPEMSTSKKVNPKFAQMQQKFAGSSSSTTTKDRSFGSVYSVKKTQLKSDLSVSNSKEKPTPLKSNANTLSKTVCTAQVNGSADDAVTATPESTKSSLVVQVTDNSSALVVEPHVTGQTISLVINNDNHEDPISVIPPVAPPGVTATQVSKTEEDAIWVNKSASPGIMSEAPLSSKTNGTMTEANNNTYVQSQPRKPSLPKSTDPPQFAKGLEDQMKVDGDLVEFVVEITGAEPMEVCWLHEQQEIPRNSNIFKFTSEGNTHKLILPEVYPEDTGMYVCEVYNDYGDEDTTCMLTVTGAQEEPPTAVYSNAKTNSQHMYKAVDEPDTVPHDGTAEPDPGFFPPEFVKRPKSETVDEGAPVKFMCEVDANPQPKVEWTKNGVLIESDGHFKVWGDGYQFNLEIPQSSAGDAGRYICTTHNSEGTEKAGVSLVVKATTEVSCTADFRSVLKRSASKFSQNAPQQDVPEQEHEQHDFRTVLKRHVDTKQRPKVISELQDIMSVEGDAVTLQCQVVGVPPPTILWFVGKREIKESKYFHMTYEGGVASLAIAEVYPEDEGEYTCRVTNTAGTVESHCDIFVQENSSQPMVAPDTVSKDHRLSLTLDKDEPPFIEDLSPENVQVLRGTTFQLRGKFAGEPRPNIQWTKEKKELTAGGRVKLEVVRDTATLTISNAECSDTGTYSLTLTNDLGQDSVTSSVTIEDKPEQPVGKASVTNVDSTSVCLSWYGPSYDGGTNVTDYRVEICNITDHSWRTLTSTCKHTSFNVTGLQPNNEYEFRVSAANKHGFGEPGEVSDPVLTIEQGPIGEEGQQSFEPRVVVLKFDRKFSDFYVLGKEIGKGRFGSVYTCTEKKLRQTFAAKIIKLRPSQREEKRMEIDIMNQLHHPKLLLLWDAFESQREITLVMEHIAGGELFERIINSDYILTERECVYFMRQICEAIDFMHSKQILHLDLKPENVLCITPNSNEIKIIDFGLARKFDPDESFKIMFGTPEFVAPEVINYDQVSYGTDMWSVGVICYILLSGLSPFMGDNDNETLVSVTMAQWDFEDDAFDEISDDAKNCIERLLVKDMRNRMSVRECLRHSWLSQDTTCMRAKRLSTAKHKKFLARRKWQKTGTAIRALGRIGGLQRALNNLGRQTPDSAQAATSGDHSRQDSLNSDSGISCSSGVSERQFHSALRSLRTQLPESELGGVGATERKSSRRMENTDSSTIVEESPADIQMEPPRFVQTMTDCEVQVGERATFKVKTIGSPPPVVTWYREGVKVGGTRRCVTTSSEDGMHTLMIRRCREQDDSCYECTAKNAAGEVTCTGDLFVLPSADN